MALKILVTGHSGFIGKNFIPQLREFKKGAEIFGASKEDCDLIDEKECEKLLKRTKPEIIFHLAGMAVPGDIGKLMEANVKTTEAMLEAVKRAGIGAGGGAGRSTRVVVAGSASVYGKPGKLPISEDAPIAPISDYGKSMAARAAVVKRFAEEGLDVVEARLFNVIGPGMPPTLSVGSFVEQLAKIKDGRQKPVLEVGNLDTKRDFVDVRDVGSALVLLARGGKRGEAYNVCSGKSASMQEVVGELLKISGVTAEVRKDGGRVRKNDIGEIRGDYGKINREAGWQPKFSLEDSLKTMWERASA